jgi:hypothetical protein
MVSQNSPRCREGLTPAAGSGPKPTVRRGDAVPQHTVGIRLKKLSILRNAPRPAHPSDEDEHFLAFPREVYRPPRSWGERRFNIQRWPPAPRGGHVAGLEEPEPLARDLREFFRPLRGT